MHPTILTNGERWRGIVDESAVKAVADTVRQVANAPFVPGPKIAGMERILAPALDALSIDRRGIATVAAHEQASFIGTLSEEARRYFASRPKDAFARAISWRLRAALDELLDDRLRTALEAALGAERAKRLRGRTWLELVRLPYKDPRNGGGELALMALQSRWAAVSYAAGFAAAGGSDRLPALRALAELVTLGNVPVGIIDTGEFLVVTA